MSYDEQIKTHEETYPTNCVKLLKQAYGHPQYARHKFGHPTSCPTCSCELIFILRSGQGTTSYSCQNCFAIFEHRELAA